MAQVSYGQMTIADLTDNYQVQLSPESASFAGGTSSAKDGNITVIVSTLQGNKRIAHTIGNPTGLPSGMTVTNKVNGTATADGSFKVNVTTALTSTSGYFTIPITVGGVVYSRRFSYSVGREGTSVTITDKSVTYQVGSSGTSAPTGTWQNTVQTPAENQYLWTKTEVTYSDGNKTVAYSVSRNAKNGTSPTVSSTKTEYQQSTNGTTPPTGTWLTSAPDAIAGQYMWTRVTVTYSDNATAISYSVSKNGADGVSVSNVTSSKSGDTTTITITYSDGRTPSTFTVKDGAKGAPGDTGATAQWYYGDKLSHTSGAVTKTTSDTATPDAVVGSMYLNPNTSLCYRCTEVNGSNATWTYAGDLTTGVINNIEIGGRNLYIVANQIAGYINTSGTITNPSSTQLEKTSDYIAVSEGEHYVFQAWCPDLASNQQMWMAYQFYSNNTGTVIGGRTAKLGTTGVKYLAYDDIVVPSGATYIRVSYRTWDTGYTKFERGNIPTDWTPAPEDTEAAITNLTELTSSLQTQIDSKIETWTQVADPATSWTTTALKDSHVGDLWYYIGETTTNPSRENNSTYKYTLSNGTYSWVKYVSGTDMTGVFDKIDGKSTIFYGTTTGTYTGVQKDDYLVDSTTGNTYKYDPTVTTNNHWVEVTNYKTGIDEAKQDVVDLDESFTQEKVFNRLTNNGQAQGLMFDDTTGDLYINASYIHSGTLTLGGNGNVNGTLKILDSNSQTVGYWSNTGLNAISGKIGGWEIDQYELSNSTQSNTSGETVYYDAVMRASTYPSGTINDTNLAFGVQKTTVSSSGSATSDETLFGVYYNGTLYSSNADIQGKITATSGSIGGFNIINTNDSTKTTANGGHSYANSLYKITNDGTYEYEVGMKASSGSTDLAFYVKRIPLGEAWNSSNLTNLFYVANNGALYASNATIDGKFTCTNTEIRSTLTIEDGVITGRWDNQETFIDLNNCQYIGGTSRGTIGLFSDDQIALYARDTIFSWGKSVLIMAGDYSNIGYRYTTGVNDYSVKICTGATGSNYYEFQADGVFKTVGLLVKTGIEIAYSTPYIDFHFNNSTADYTSRLIETSSGVLDLKKSGGTYGTLRAVISNQSSIHVKRNITDISSDDANKLLSLRPVEFDYKWGQHDYGMIAEEVYEYLPNLVTIPDGFDADTYEYKNMDDQVPSLRYQQFIPYIIKLLQNQQAEINELKGRNLQ